MAPPPLSQIQVLEKFYTSTNGPRWKLSVGAKLRTPWNFTKSVLGAYLSDPCSDNWYGIVCEKANVTELKLSYSNLTGTFPPEVFLLMNLKILSVSGNKLFGKLPKEIGQLTRLTVLDMYDNCLSGGIPTEIGLLRALGTLQLGQNSLSTSLPSELGLLAGLTGLYLSNNTIVGNIPREVGNLSSLQYLKLDFNGLTGFLPSELGLLTKLKYLVLSYNKIQSSIPNEIQKMSSLQRIDLSVNCLDGFLPKGIGELTVLSRIFLSNNHLCGTVPSEYGRLTKLSYLDLSQNKLEGTVPSEMGLLAGLVVLDLHNNNLGGKLPTELGQLSHLRYLYLHLNSLEGKLPTELGLMVGLGWLFVSKNSLTGYLPTQLGLMSKELLSLNVNGNFVSGTIPKEIGQLTRLFQLDLQSNNFEGSLPSELVLLKDLKYLYANSNRLVGSLPEKLSELDDLEFLAVHDNNLHGHLPSKLPPNLALLSLAKNCFTGTLTPSLCNATSLQYLILDGLSAGNACQTSIWQGHPFGFNALKSTSRMRGSIPACIYSLPNLELLHVSGNGLRGSLQAGPAGWSRNLTDLSLSHNALKGDVPPSLKLRLQQISKLDLSYNRFDGTLEGFHPASNHSSGLFSLELNRLSGHIPSAVTRMKGEVRVLQGNLFECSRFTRGASLPPADPAYNEYSCGSHSIDVYLFVFASLFALSVASFRWRPMLFWLTSRNKAALEALQRRPVSIQAVLYHVRSLAVLAGVVLLLVYLPLYGALKPFFGAFEFQYTWTVAAIMLSGTAPAAVLLTFWSLALAAISSILVWFRDLKGSTLEEIEADVDTGEAGEGRRNEPTWNERFRLGLRLTIISVLNLALAGAVNIAFVSVVVGDYSYTDKSLATVALGMYKSAWMQVIDIAIDSHVLLLGVDRAVEQRTKFLKAGDLFRTLMQVINVVVMPAFAVAVTDPSCFKHLLFAAPSIESGYNSESETPSETIFSLHQTVVSRALINFTPAFSYDYGCSGTLVEKFSPVFAQVALTSAFVLPAAAAGARWALDSMQSRGLGERFSDLRSVLLVMLPSLLLYRKSERDLPGCLRFLRPKTFIKADKVQRQSVTDVALMLSIGLVAPLLGLLFAVSIVSRCLMWEFLIDRFLSLPDEHLEGDVLALDKQCLHLGSLGKTALYNARWLLATFPALFLALFVSDMAGDAAGIESALWAPILMALLPTFALFVLTRLLPPSAGNALSENPEGQERSDTRVSFALLGIASETVPGTGNPLHTSSQLPSLELVELGDQIPEPT